MYVLVGSVIPATGTSTWTGGARESEETVCPATVTKFCTGRGRGGGSSGMGRGGGCGSGGFGGGITGKGRGKGNGRMTGVGTSSIGGCMRIGWVTGGCGITGIRIVAMGANRGGAA